MAQNAEDAPLPALTVDDWARRAAAGDERAWSRLVAALAPQWHAVARRMLGDHERAAEVSADVAVRVYRALPRFRFDASVRTWSYRILMNAVIEARRERRVDARSVTLEQAAELHAPAVADPVLRIALEQAMRTLPEQLREVVTLRYDAGMRFAEIAAVLHIPVGTVSTRLRRALAQLARQLDLPNPSDT